MIIRPDDGYDGVPGYGELKNIVIHLNESNQLIITWLDSTALSS